MKKLIILVTAVLFLLPQSGCSSSSASDVYLTQTVFVDGQQLTISVPSASSVLDVLNVANISLGELDRVSPPSYTLLDQATEIIVTRVTEEYSVVDVVIPFETQIIQNESLSEGHTILVQPGINGLEQITYRKAVEDGVIVSTNIFSRSVISEPVSEITMVGISKPFTATSIPGRLAFLLAGNAWIMEGSTENRRLVVSTGDLDGYAFSISFDQKWLLFSRRDKTGDQGINSLWIVNLEEENASPYSLGVSNVIMHAAWMPGAVNTITYSTVEPRATAPGWQSNNDLYILSFSDGGSVWRNENIIDVNGGGEYGWWGTSFFWSPDGGTLIYSRPDGIGSVDFNTKTLVPLIDLIPLNTHSDWAWVPQISWSPTSGSFFYPLHETSLDVSDQQTSPLFSLAGTEDSDLSTGILGVNVGMFSNPSASAITEYGHFKIAYYIAIFPEQSDTSRYQLFFMDRDGSNQQPVLPQEGSAGMDPRKVVWAPDRSIGEPYYFAVVYEGNLWLVDSESGEAKQITSDGLISIIDWK